MNMIVTIQEDPETGESIIEIPQEILDKMNLAEGDEIIWEFVDNRIEIKKRSI